MNNRDPMMGGNALNRGEKRLTGIDLIYEYLKIIRMEKKFLDCFDRQAVVNLMSAIYPQYQELYLDNLCSPVLWQTGTGTERPVSHRKLFHRLRGRGDRA